MNTKFQIPLTSLQNSRMRVIEGKHLIKIILWESIPFRKLHVGHMYIIHVYIHLYIHVYMLCVCYFFVSSLLLLTLRGLSLFYKILPISNTGVSAAYILATVHFNYPKLGSFSNMEYYFYQLAYRDLKVPKCFVGLNQMQCSPSFDWNWDKQNDLHP